MEMKTEYKDTAIVKLDGLADVEHTIGRCFEHLAALVRNGRARNKFIACSVSAKKNKETCMELLRKLGAADAVFEDKCSMCKLDPASFSFDGALRLGIEINDIAIRYYEDLVALSAGGADKRELRRLIREKNRHKEMLKKERKFEHAPEPGSSEHYTISDAVVRMYR